MVVVVGGSVVGGAVVGGAVVGGAVVGGAVVGGAVVGGAVVGGAWVVGTGADGGPGGVVVTVVRFVVVRVTPCREAVRRAPGAWSTAAACRLRAARAARASRAAS